MVFASKTSVGGEIERPNSEGHLGYDEFKWPQQRMGGCVEFFFTFALKVVNFDA